jgi:benzylsuccinate CoA-transferase BbsF subunit
VDHVAGMYAALAVLAALRRRDRTGQGAYLDISQYEAACSLMIPELLDYSANNTVALPTGNRGGNAAGPYGCYRCRGDDRWCVIAVSDDEGWNALCRAMGNPGLAQDTRFADNELRAQHADELDEVIESWTSKYSPERVAEVLQKQGTAASAVQDARDLAGDRHLQERCFFINMSHPLLGEMITDATPMRLSASPAQIKSPAPLLGQHSREVLLGIVGMDEGRYADLVSRGIIS